MQNSEILELKIPLNGGTIKKIVALAALSGQSLEEIKDSIATNLVDEEAFDLFVSELLQKALSEIDGPAKSAQPPVRQTLTRTHVINRPVQEAAPSIETDSLSGHSLSSDQDTEETLSLSEQYEKEESNLRAAPPRAPFARDEDFPEANDIDDFINFLEQDEQAVEARGVSRTRPTTAKSRGTKKAKISGFTGDDDGPMF